MLWLIGIGVYAVAKTTTSIVGAHFSRHTPKGFFYKLGNRGQIMEVSDRIKMENNFSNYVDDYQRNHIFKRLLTAIGGIIPGVDIWLSRIRARSCLKEKLASQEFSGSIRQMTPEEQQRFSIDRRSINPPTRGFIYSRNLTPPHIINEQQKNNLRFTKEEIERHFAPYGRTCYAMVNGKPTVIMGLSDRKFNELGNNPAKPTNIKLTVKRRRRLRPRVDAVLNVVPIPDSERDNKDYTVMYLGGNKPNILAEGYRNTYNARMAQRQAQQQAQQNQQQQAQQNQQQQNQQNQQQQNQQNQQQQNQQNQQQQAQQNQQQQAQQNQQPQNQQNQQPQNQQPQNQQQQAQQNQQPQNQQQQNVPQQPQGFIIGNGIYGGVPQTTVQPAQQQAQPVGQQPVYQPMAQPVYQPMAQPVYQPMAQPVYQPMAQPVYQPMAQPVYQPMYQSSMYPIPYNGMVPGVTGFGINPVGMQQLAASGAGYALVPVGSLAFSPSQTQTPAPTVS